jgi:Arc/MetJ-type ribon-helix-helix transcriptional regulator
MALTLRPETEAVIERTLATGRFADVDELIATAIGALHVEQEANEGFRSLIRTKLETSFAAASRGDTVSSEEFEAEMNAWRANIE